MIDEKALVRAVKRAMDGAGTPTARDAVKLWPSDWHLICDLVLNPDRQAAKLAQALEDERRQAIAEYTRQIDDALRRYDENLSYGDDALGPDHFIERGMETAAAAIRARAAAAMGEKT